MSCKIVEVSEFSKDLRKLKKFRSIIDDVENFKKVLLVNPEDMIGAVRISGLGEDFLPTYKAKKFRCKSLKSASRIRVIYCYDSSEKEVTLLEIYFKGQKENHDLERIKRYAKTS